MKEAIEEAVKLNIDLSFVNFENANLFNANLSNANLRYANLENSNLSNATLENANLDFSTFPLLCGSFNIDIKKDPNLIYQLLYHICKIKSTNINVKIIQYFIKIFANKWKGIDKHNLEKIR